MTKPTKTNKMNVHLAQTGRMLCTQWVSKDPSFSHANSEDSDQTGQMPRLIWVFAARTLILLGFSCRGSYVLYSDAMINEYGCLFYWELSFLYLSK